MAASTPIPLLYYHPGSFYSQKVLIALEEKGIQYDKHITDPSCWEQYAPWYMKINPLGQLPCMKHGDKIIIDSKAITEYLDENFDGPTLIPKEYKHEINRLIGLIDAINVPVLTYGILTHPELPYIKNPTMSSLFRAALSNRSGETEPLLRKYMNECKDDAILQDAYKAKLATIEVKPQNLNEENIIKAFEEAKKVMDDIEHHLENKSREPSKKLAWLSCDTFTAADIALAVFLHRMVWIGLAEDLLQSRPHLTRYKERLYKENKSFRKFCVNFMFTDPFIIKKMIAVIAKKIWPFAVGVIALGLGMWLYSKE